MAEGMTKLSDQIPNDECYTIKDLSADLGVGIQMTRKVVDRALKARVVQNLTKKDGAATLFAPQMAQGIIQAYQEGKLGRVRKSTIGKTLSKNMLKKAAMVISIPIFDDAKADIIKTQFQSEHDMIRFVQEKFDEITNPRLTALAELEREFAAKREAILNKKR